MPLINELTDLIDELVSKTAGKRLRWREVAASGRFVTVVDGTKIQIWRWQRSLTDENDEMQLEPVISFQLFDAADHEIVSADIGQSELHFGRLESLHDSALFSARDVGSVVANLLNRLKEPPKPRLTIKRAEYGAPGTPSIDVTSKLSEMVVGDKLTVEATNSIFTDPAVNKARHLTVEFILDGKSETKTVSEDQTLTIP